MEVMDQANGKDWAFYNADCVTFARGLPDASVDLAVYSPPFSSLYVYSESVADMGNVADDAEFFEQYRFMVREKFRILRPGRISAIHVKDLVYYQNASQDGSSGLRAFSDECTRVHIEEGFTFHCRITINRDPVLERAKTNAHGLLWKTFQGDASFCRVGMPEYLMVYRKWAKPGEEELVRPVAHPKDKVPLERWQDLAYPTWHALPDQMQDACAGHPNTIWNDVPSGSGDHAAMRSTDVLNVDAARDEQAEKHLCPMPLNITGRAVELWTNKGDVVFSPFGGIASEGVAALRAQRRFIGTELHPAYWQQGVKFLQQEERVGSQPMLFAAE
jgi:hypothetical protein